MNNSKTYSGGCLCGAVTFTAEDVSVDVHACHCKTCRNWSGGSMLAASAATVEFSGEANIARYDSSAWAQRGFCRLCGSSLFFQLHGADHFVMCLGAFDDSADFNLSGEIFVDEKPRGYDFQGDHSRLTGADFLASIGAGDPDG